MYSQKKEMTMAKLFKEKYNKLPTKYDITSEVNIMLLKGRDLKRIGKYSEAQEIYDKILKDDGASGILYIAMAKNLACNGEYASAIKLFELANKACINEFSIQDENCLYHIEQIKNSNNLEKNFFLQYMKSIAGNPTYELPLEIERVINVWEIFIANNNEKVLELVQENLNNNYIKYEIKEINSKYNRYAIICDKYSPTLIFSVSDNGYESFDKNNICVHDIYLELKNKNEKDKWLEKIHDTKVENII